MTGGIATRYGALLAGYLAVLLTTTVIGHLLLPEGLLRSYSEGRGGAAVDNVPIIAGQIAVFNLVTVLLLVIAGLFASRRDANRPYIPTSFHVLVVLAVLNGIVLGTNSFAIPTANTSLTSKTVGLFDLSRHAALWEIAALVLLAAALYPKSLVLRTGRETETRRWRAISWTRGEIVAVGVALVLLVIGALVEANSIASAVAPR